MFQVGFNEESRTLITTCQAFQETDSTVLSTARAEIYVQLRPAVPATILSTASAEKHVQLLTAGYLHNQHGEC